MLDRGEGLGRLAEKSRVVVRLSSAYGSKGALGDVGVHIVDYATFPCGPIKEVFCRMRAFPKAPGDRVGEYTLDANDSAVLNVEFANGALGTIHTSRWVGGHANRLALKIAGTKGTIFLDSDVSTTAFKMCNGRGLDKSEWREVACKPVPTNYQRFIKAIRSGTPGEADFTRGAGVQKIFGRLLRIGQKETPGPALNPTFRNRRFPRTGARPARRRGASVRQIRYGIFPSGNPNCAGSPPGTGWLS